MASLGPPNLCSDCAVTVVAQRRFEKKLKKLFCYSFFFKCRYISETSVNNRRLFLVRGMARSVNSGGSSYVVV